MKSALFVDFDNVYTQLKDLQPDAAERFARHPSEWIRWMVESLGLPEGHEAATRRRLLVRRCYLNPSWYQNYRHAYLRAGFEIVDCPPVTSQGKTSTDIHMVLDIVELLQHETRYDEFIVLSADADFSPVLRKLRRYDRRTSVLAIGFPSAAYQASADLLIDERRFVEEALGLPLEPQEGEASNAADAKAVQDVGGAAPVLLTVEALAQIGHLIEQTVSHSCSPVLAAALASRLRQQYGAALDDWNGHGAFRPFFQSLGLDGLVWLSGSGGRIAHGVRHADEIDVARRARDPVSAEDLPEQATDIDAWAGHETLLPMAREVSQLTGAPLLAPLEVRALLESLSTDLALHSFDLSATARRVREACAWRTPSVDVSIRDTVFILRGMQLNGHAFGRGMDDVRTLAERLRSQVLFLCQREEMVIDPERRAQIGAWLGGDLLE
ncbi:MAG: NYN domain-containing protein [Xanthomonadales bacterium]|nr:hypothetical protein [Xanthomonadales bacterium]MCC6594818.1 NYN domain-containing protein [Xanthomonadales bacterium]MCE7929992.1 NYN domain-containing protein [Xanthomonadales bacterium PRO6]